MALIKATSRFEPDDDLFTPSRQRSTPEVTGDDMLDTFRRDRNVLYPAWWENPVALAKRRIRELAIDNSLFIQHGDFACTVYHTVATTYTISIFRVMSKGKVALEIKKSAAEAAEHIAQWIASQTGWTQEEETLEMATPSPKAIELLNLLTVKGEVAVDKAAWGGQLIGALVRMKYVEEADGKLRITDKGRARLVEVANEPRHTPRKRKVIFEHEPQPLAESDSQAAPDDVADLASPPTDVVEAATGETVESAVVTLTSDNGETDVYDMTTLVRYAAAAQPVETQVQPSSYIRIEMSYERHLSEDKLFELYPDLEAMVRAIRATGAQVEVCARVNTDVRGYQHE